MTDPYETLARIREQADAATDGPWRHISIFEVGGFVEDAHGRDLFDWAQDDAGTICAPDPDAEFIASSRTTVPAFLDAFEKVLRIHRDGGESQGYDMAHGGDYRTMPRCCTECGSCGEYGVPYPCPTVTAITTTLERLNHD